MDVATNRRRKASLCRVDESKSVFGRGADNVRFPTDDSRGRCGVHWMVSCSVGSEAEPSVAVTTWRVAFGPALLDTQKDAKRADGSIVTCVSTRVGMVVGRRLVHIMEH